MPGRKVVYGVTVGILMVKTYFRRFPGDIGNAETWSFPVQYRIVDESSPARMTELHKESLLAPFKAAAQDLIAAGVDGIATTCGFLSIYQKELADFCGIPVATSSLLQVPMVERLISSDKRVGILTYDGAALTGPYLEAAGIAADTPVYGMPPTSEFVRSIRQGDASVSFDTLKGEVLDLASRMLAENPTIGAIVLECTNLAPFTAAISDRFGLPVFDTVSLVNWFHAGLRPRRFPTA
ncbi:aspartate/glutamate racemase family protein [Telmatospirillum sp.]|uniref:aspartate/glutamate racemase family protein n=1 Tax=Telmatospirillum sp. TaxID=2079197 RepID=UPI002845B774|nr:aspartate/glutamate racemase family protein [Telmatospirillum sp.]MDR3435383.1 aspartate/glutamate racemase family protein [Telmatospirillum sp.]